MGLGSTETILTNPGPCTLEGICSNTEDAGEIEAKCEASGVSGGEEQTGDDQSILWHQNVGIEEGYVDGLATSGFREESVQGNLKERKVSRGRDR